jgi:hypothetical protein
MPLASLASIGGVSSGIAKPENARAMTGECRLRDGGSLR